jgi:hypothetical protein
MSQKKIISRPRTTRRNRQKWTLGIYQIVIELETKVNDQGINILSINYYLIN